MKSHNEFEYEEKPTHSAMNDSNIKCIFVSPLFQQITNGPSKFTNILYESSLNNNSILVASEDHGNKNNKLIKIPRIPKFIKRSLSNHIYRNFLYLYFFIRHKPNPEVVLAFNDVISSYLCAKFLPNPVIGFINDSSNLQQSLLKITNLSQLQRFFIRILEKKAVTNANVIICNSRYLSNLINKKYKVDRAKIELLYKGTSIDDSPTPFKNLPSDSKIIVLFVKSDFKRGNLPKTIMAVNLVSLERTIELRVIGTDRLTFEKKIMSKNKYRDLDLSNTVFLGKQSQKVVKLEMTNAHIFCVPSISEALGVANMEAMEKNIPVVTSQVEGIPEVTNEGRNCWEVNYKNPISIAEGLKNCYLRPEETRMKVISARKHIIEKFSSSDLPSRFLEIVLKYYHHQVSVKK